MNEQENYFNYIDYLVLDNKNITSYNIYSNNSISFYKELLKGLYQIIVYRKKNKYF